MKKAKPYLFNSLAGFLFIALLAVNVHIGSGNGVLGIGDTYINEAKANMCEESPETCFTMVINGIIWPVDGQPLVVTPDE